MMPLSENANYLMATEAHHHLGFGAGGFDGDDLGIQTVRIKTKMLRPDPEMNRPVAERCQVGGGNGRPVGQDETAVFARPIAMRWR